MAEQNYHFQHQNYFKILANHYESFNTFKAIMQITDMTVLHNYKCLVNVLIGDASSLKLKIVELYLKSTYFWFPFTVHY